MPQQPRTSERGFTIIETVVSLVVMMVVGLGAASLFLYSVRNNSGAAARTQAIAYAQQMMERVRALDIDDPVLDEGENTWTCMSGECEADPPATAATATATASASATSGNSKGNGKNPKPTPTPPPTPSPSPTPDGDDDDNYSHGGHSSYSMTMNVEMLDDVDGANPPRKRITMEFRPNMSGVGDNEQQEKYWANNPVRVVVVRSARGVGRYRQ